MRPHKGPLLVALLVPALVAACEAGGAGPKTGTAGTTAAGSAGTSASGTAGTSGGAAGTTATAGTSGGAAGVNGAAGTAAAGSGAAGTAAAAGTGGGQPDGGAAGTGLPMGDCGAGSIFCEGFEDYPILKSPYDAMGNSIDLTKTGETMPTWLSYHFHGPPRVDTSKPFKGKQNFHLDTESGHTASADVIKMAPDGADLWPAAHYGRVMVWLKTVPPTSAFGIVTEQGLLPGSTTDTAQFTIGGVGGKLALSYTQRKRVVKNDASLPKMRRGGDAQPADAMPIVQCRVASATAFPGGKWACVEWMIDRTKSEMHLWVDSTAVTDVDIVGKAGTCAIGTAPAAFTGPAHFTELDMGWEIYGNDGGGSWEAWYDELAIGTQRLGCPAP